MHLVPMRFVRWPTLMLWAAVIGGSIPLAADDWPEWRARTRAGVWNESGVIDTFPPGGLAVRWRTPIHAGYAGPAIAGGRVFDRGELVPHGSRRKGSPKSAGPSCWSRPTPT